MLYHIFFRLPVIAYHVCMKKKRRGEKESGGRLNKKDGLTRYGDSHVKDKTS